VENIQEQRRKQNHMHSRPAPRSGRKFSRAQISISAQISILIVFKQW